MGIHPYYKRGTLKMRDMPLRTEFPYKTRTVSFRGSLARNGRTLAREDALVGNSIAIAVR